MILTQCAVCATELGTGGKKCGRCSTRYCGPECQVQHWKEGGHDKLCKIIKKAGGAEQYHADKKCKEAVAVAVETCADDTKGQTCYICTQAVHWKTKEGLVRMCACRGTAGFAHVSCLAEQAKILIEEVEENNLAHKVMNERWQRWSSCSLCKQQYHGVVMGALGWACWKTYVGRSETDNSRLGSMKFLGRSFRDSGRAEDELAVHQATLDTFKRYWQGNDEDQNALDVMSNMAGCYSRLGQHDKCVTMRREIYARRVATLGFSHEESLNEAHCIALTLVNRPDRDSQTEAKVFLRDIMPRALEDLGPEHQTYLRFRWVYAYALHDDDAAATLDDMIEAEATYVAIERVYARRFGPSHPETRGLRGEISNLRENMEKVRDCATCEDPSCRWAQIARRSGIHRDAR